jgi:hypothetical protein
MPRTTKGGPKAPKTPVIDPLLAKIQAAAAKLEEAERNDYTHYVKDEALIVKEDTNLVRVQAFYDRVGITSEEVAAFPCVTDNFKDVGGTDGVIRYFRGSEDKNAKEIVRLFDLNRGQTQLAIPFEAYCVAAKVTKKKFMQLLMGEVCEQSDVVSTLLAAQAHPDIVKKTVSVALSDQFGANESRAILHKHRGFLPTPKTQQVNIHGNVNQDNRQDNSKNLIIPLGDLAIGSGKIAKATDRFNAARIVRSESTDLAVAETDQTYEDPEGYDTE